MQSLGAVATTLKRKVKEVHYTSCRGCDINYINKLGPKRRLKRRLLKENRYICPACIRSSLNELETKVYTISLGFISDYNDDF